MSIRQKRPAKRWAAAAVVIGSVSAVMASPLALGTAAAAPVSSITIGTAPAPVPSTPAPATATATVHATYAPAANPAPTDFMYAVTSSIPSPGDQSGAGGLAGTPCTADTAGNITCDVANTSHAAATDTVKVFEDTGSTPGQLDGTDVQSAPTSVVFSGAPNQVNFTTAPTGGTAGTCTDYTAHASLGGNGPAAGNQPLDLTVTESSTTDPGSTPITLFPTGCANGGSTTTGNNVTGSSPWNNTYTHQVTTDSNGDVTFGIKTSTAGTGTVKLSVPSNPATSTATVNVTWTAGGANAVTTLTPSPASTTQLTSTIASFTVTATNGGAPVQGVEVLEQSTGGPDTLGTTSCGTTSASGQVTCTVHNAGTAGADQLTFWVNNTSGACSHTNGPDSCEPQGHATATFNAAPAVSAANSTLTCVQQLSGADKGNAKTDCTVPLSQTSVTFTATVEDASGNPIANAPVTFTATAAKLGGTTLSGANLPASATTNTGTNGVATYTVNDATPANGDNVTVHAAVGATSVGTASAHWVASVATSLSVVPDLQTVTQGGTVTVKATVVDQFGNPVSGSPNITYFVSGRNNAKSGTAAADGTITYTDAGTVPAQKTDTIQVTDNTNHFNATAKVSYVTGATTASTVTVDTSGAGTSDATCAVTGHTAATNVALQHTTEVCAVVKNATNEALAGKTVTFTVSDGQVAAHGALAASSGKTYTATTDEAGVAFADVTSTKSGAQTVTATADGQSGTGTVTYAAPVATAAYAISLAPATGTVNPGTQQKFTATVTDKFGNPVSGVSVNFTQSGPGSLGGASSASVTTAADGTAAVTLSTTAADSGSGSLTATIATAGTQCASATTGTPPSSCSATATYTVAVTGNLALTLKAEHNAKAGTHETVKATVTNADHTPAANQVVRFFITGANTGTASATTDATGRARIAYLAKHHGTDTIAVYVDSNADQIRQADEPKRSITAHILGRERPHLRLTSNNGRIKAHVNTRPNADHAVVRYYVKRHGSWHKLGSSHTNGHGNDHHSFKFKVGSHHKLRAKVSATAITTAGTSPAKKIRVKR
jgi:adhesin/invasin